MTRIHYSQGHAAQPLVTLELRRPPPGGWLLRMRQPSPGRASDRARERRKCEHGFACCAFSSGIAHTYTYLLSPSITNNFHLRNKETTPVQRGSEVHSSRGRLLSVRLSASEASGMEPPDQKFLPQCGAVVHYRGACAGENILVYSPGTYARIRAGDLPHSTRKF